MGRHKVNTKQRRIFVRANDTDWQKIQELLPNNTCARADLILYFLRFNKKGDDNNDL